MNVPPVTVTVIYRKIRLLLVFFICALVISGLTAIPLETELKTLTGFLSSAQTAHPSVLARWLLKVQDGLVQTNANYPFMAYGTDWLAFAHLVIAVAFIGAYRDPVRNAWVIEFGMIACAMVIIFPFIMGPIRQIPFGWRLIDASFGLFGLIPLWLCRRYIQQLSHKVEPASV